MRIYLASSWRNQIQPAMVKLLREQGHLVYDFRNPKPEDKGFNWREIDANWIQWTKEEYRLSLENLIAVAGFNNDWEAMQWADCCVLLLPSGRSAHLEAGYFVGVKKPLYILLDDGFEAELMYKMATELFINKDELIKGLTCLSIMKSKAY